MRAFSPAAIAAGLVLSLLPACNGVLGIDEAVHDPSLDPGAASGAGGGSGSAGSSGSGASAGSSGTGGQGGKGGAGGQGPGGQSGASGAAGAPVDPVCASYCSTVMTNCTGDLQEYPSIDICISMCSNLDNGPVTDMTGNTVECRANHAKAAVEAGLDAAQKATHCNAAGPLGGNVCGTVCQSFCLLNLALCAPPILTDSTYPTGAKCLEECGMLVFKQLEQSDFAKGEGNTLNCRDYHLQAAYKSETAAKTHCSHTAVDSSTCN